MKTDNSLECCVCNKYNIEQGVLVDGNLYCWDCIKGDRFKVGEVEK